MTYAYKRDLVVLGIVLLGALVFLYVAGYISLTRPFGFAFEPYVSISKSFNSPSGFIGSVYGGQSLATFDVKPWFFNGNATTKKVVFHVRLRPPASQAPNNGLNSFVLLYYHCFPVLGYGYGYGYYQSTQCQHFVAYPSHVLSSREESIVVFDGSSLDSSRGFPLNENANVVMMLRGTVAFTGINQLTGKTLEVNASIEGQNDVAVQALDGQQIRVRPSRVAGNWLRVLSGYGYPRLR